MQQASGGGRGSRRNGRAAAAAGRRQRWCQRVVTIDRLAQWAARSVALQTVVWVVWRKRNVGS